MSMLALKQEQQPEPQEPKVQTARSRLDSRILITVAVIAVICGIFWLSSRYPSLQSKAGADPDEALSTPLGFESHFPEPRADEKFKRILWVALEWGVTNKQGMTFGILLAAALLTLIPLLPRPRRGKFAGSVQGMLLGAPLGVCINCAAPIGQAMLKGGSRVEVALATMFASPSFNVIVLGMLLTLFPWYLAAIKVVTSLLMVLVVVPFLARQADRPGWRKPIHAPPRMFGLRIFQRIESAFSSMSETLLTPAGDEPKGFFHALVWVVMRYGKNLWTVIRLSLPLMIAAGLFGAALAELLPWARIAQIAQVEGFLPNAAVLLVVAAFGTVLPIPIAFDVVVCAVLWNAGVPMYVVATLLVTLALYSIYPWSLIGTTLSWRIAALAGAAVLVLGIGAGATAGLLYRWHDLRTVQQAASLLETLPAPKVPPPVLPTGRTAAELRGLAPALPPMSRILATSDVELTYGPFAAAHGGGDKPFARIEGTTIGFDRLPLPRPYLTMQTGAMHLGGTAAGDVNGDGWQDIAMGTNYGVFLYLNLGGRFALQQIDFPAMKEWTVPVVALVDLDGDGALDLFFCAWRHGCHILYNRGGEFSQAQHVELPTFDEVAVTAVAFADFDHDGLLDIVTGTSTFEPRFFYPAPAVNRLWHNRGNGKFEPEALAGPEGETLTLLATDLNGDGWPDLYVGNDFDEPDRVYLNDHGKLVPVKAAGSPFEISTNTTMSADSGDLDNDGRDELYFAQIAMGNSVSEMAKRLKEPVGNCDIFVDLADRARCNAMAAFQLRTISAWQLNSIDPCLGLLDPGQQRDCVVVSHHWFRVLARLPALGADKAKVLEECAKIPADFREMHDVCTTIALSPMDNEESDVTYADEMPQLKHTNLLYASDGSGKFHNATGDWKAGFGGWSWNAKFADLDNDGWQDLYVAQGSRLRPNSVSATFYKNMRGKNLADATKAYGLEDHIPTGSYVYVDLDGDGDLDIVTHPFQLTPVAWRNDAPRGPGFQVSLDDRTSQNRTAIGARVEIRAPDGRLQVREIKASGGYASYDPPVAFFGLGDWEKVASIRVKWPDGGSSDVQGAPLAPGRYTLARLHR